MKVKNKTQFALFVLFIFLTSFLKSQTFPCDNGARLYFFRNSGLPNGSLSYVTNYTNTPVITDMFQMPTSSHNALAGNPVDNYLYYLEGTNLRRLDALGGNTVVCVLPFSSAYGCFNNLGQFCAIFSGSLVVYDISTCTTVNSFSLPPLSGFVDIVYNVFDNHYYVGNLKVTTGGVVILNNMTNFTPGGFTWGAVAMGSNGLIYGFNNTSPTTLSAINVISNTTFTTGTLNPGVIVAGGSDAASFMCTSGISASVCAGSSATLSAANLFVLANPQYSIQPGGTVQANPVFTVTPPSTTNYTIYVTGTNSVNAVVTQTVAASVTVNAQPQIAPTFTQASCSNTVNAVNLGLTFNPPAPVPNYSVIWSPTPPGVGSPTQSTASNLSPGVTNVTVITSNGCSVTTSFTMGNIPSPAEFTVTPPGGIYSITCANPTLSIFTAPANYTYTWVSLSNTLSGTSGTFSSGSTGNYTITANNGIAGCSTTQTISIVQNTIAPTTTVNPTSQAITCNSGAPVTFSGTVSNPTINIQHDWYSPLNPLPGGVPIATSNNTISILSGAIPPGVYTLVTTNQVNGCTTQKTVTITSLSAWPTFSLSSPTNFSVGCVPLNSTTISIINPVSTQTPPATCSYTFLAPTFTGVVTPSVILGNNSSTTTTLPGTWTIIVQDNSNFCRTTIQVPVLQNTVAPNVSASLYTPTLTCRNPTVIATGTTTTPNTIITWNVPSTPPTLSTHTVVIGNPANGPNTSTTSLTYANFTVVATNTLNACQSTSVVQINQNFKPPISNPTISIATPTAIYCMVNEAPVVLTTGNSTTTSGGGPSAFVANPCWEGPSPQVPICGPSSYSCYVPGIYTLTIEDNYNGCTKSGTVNVLDRTQPPVLLDPFATATLDCGTNNASSFSIIVTGTNTGGLRYLVTDYPAGVAFSPTNAIAVTLNPILSGTSNSVITVDATGFYRYVVSNTLTGCQAAGEVNVVNGVINAAFEADPQTGYAPLNVMFTNNSASSGGTSSISSVWSFGNGETKTSTTNISFGTVYNAPGKYNVMLITQKGSCVDTAYKVIQVDMPSKLEVPNIFTPNGDGSNDVFFLKVANISEIDCVILDRWGNKVYETKSSTGNIAWDGKNFSGQEAEAGVYFYIIKAKGKDDKEYESKGNVTLMR
ncbi:MAG: gliding motility-associated C-terminal domain-containing protein [Sphingobacteriaceae bacterium]|nr:gliding motility-associated C-terminal domain-containing protein [Sphingobacteriaceae bacterium]